MFRKVYDSLLTVVYPQVCQICENSVENYSDGTVCRDCWETTRIFTGNEILCARCGAYLIESKTPIETFCHRCDEHLYDAARAVGTYENALAASIIHLKSEPFVSGNLQKLFVSAFYNSTFQNADLIIPVPLSKKRLLERGFNQAAILAKILGKETKIKVDANSLVRNIHTPMHRAAMDRKAREATVKNAFEVSRAELIKNKTILLVDDVFTSGATVSNCAEALKKEGAGKVYVLTVARAC
ncbi:MAG TPA: ComF family protein [Pyrinomonadaceae bacterium]|jgi:competence protein ComFC